MESIGSSYMDDPVVQLILSGEAETASQAERLYLDRHLDEVIGLVNSPLSDDELRRHPLIQILLSHGSRPWEDSLQ